MNCRISGRVQSQLSQHYQGYDVSDNVMRIMAEGSQLPGEYTPVVSELFNWQQCHSGFLLLTFRYFRSSGLMHQKQLWLLDNIMCSHYNA